MHAGELAEMDYLRGLAGQLATARKGERGRLLAAAQAHLGVSRDTIYNRLRAVGWASGRKLRTDKGDSRVSLDEVKAVAGILRASQRNTGKELLPTGDAISVALANGMLKARVADSTMLRLMRKHNMHPRQLARPDPHVQLASKHPNHVWEIDASICVLYYLHNGRCGVMDERKFNVRKPRDLASVARDRLLRYVCTDHCSGDVIARYYNVPGENQQVLFEFMMWCMRPQPGRVMHGVPWMLVWDAGCANVSHGISALLDGLAVRHWTHVPGNPRAKGQVEVMNNVIERKFEGRLTFTRIDSVEQLNAELDTWLKAFNGTAIHSRHRHARDAVWQTIREDQLRLCPPREDCEPLVTSKPERRVVSGNLTVQFTVKGFDPAVYSVEHVPNVRAGENVLVAVNPYRKPSIFIVGEAEDGSTRYIECDPTAKDANGFLTTAAIIGEQYSSKPDTAIDTARKDLNEAAYGKRDTLEAINARNHGTIAFNGAIDPFKDAREAAANAPSHIARPGTQLNVPNPVQVDLRPLNHYEAARAVQHLLQRPLTRDDNALIQALYPDGVPESELNTLASRLEAPVAPERPRLSIVGGSAA